MALRKSERNRFPSPSHGTIFLIKQACKVSKDMTKRGSERAERGRPPFANATARMTELERDSHAPVPLRHDLLYKAACRASKETAQAEGVGAAASPPPPPLPHLPAQCSHDGLQRIRMFSRCKSFLRHDLLFIASLSDFIVAAVLLFFISCCRPSLFPALFLSSSFRMYFFLPFLLSVGPISGGTHLGWVVLSLCLSC